LTILRGKPCKSAGKYQKKTYKVQGVGILKESGEYNYSAFINIDYLKKLMQENEREEKRIAASLAAGNEGSVGYYNASYSSIGCLPRIQPMRRYW